MTRYSTTVTVVLSWGKIGDISLLDWGIFEIAYRYGLLSKQKRRRHFASAWLLQKNLSL